MKFRVTYERQVAGTQWIEGDVEAENFGEALQKVADGDFKKWLVVKEALATTDVSEPKIEEVQTFEVHPDAG